MNEFYNEVFLPIFKFVILAMFITVIVIISIVFISTLIKVICKGILFFKAGKPGWAVIVPVYNKFVQSSVSFGDCRGAVIWLVVFVPFVVCTVIGGLLNVFGNTELTIRLMFLFETSAMAIGLAMAVVNGINMYFFAKAFGKSTGFCVVSAFFAPICLILMAYSKKTRYVGYSDFGKKQFENIRAKLGF